MEKSSAATAAAAEEVPVAVKKEALSDDIKEFAETAMNELLGWYGYGSHRDERGSRACRSHSGSNSSGPESPKYNEGCGWCGKPVDENTGLSSSAAIFCSELCFSQSRRANFKKNKTCDWCRHVRHTVSYVDSQDGASQLQFCSDKCLNQYKMHIFWRETRAHLEIHPHIHGEESSSSTLITPDLWMTKCKSPELQESSPSSLSPKPADNQQQTSPLPLITVAHPSKLMSVPPEPLETKRPRNKMQKKMKKKSLPISITPLKPVFSEMPQDLRVRHPPPADFTSPRLGGEETVVKPVAQRSDQRPNHVPPFPPPAVPRVAPPQYFSNTTPDVVPHRKLLDSLLPPPTVLVPYPVILPIPIPIPLPIPFPIPSSLLDKTKDSQRVDASCQTDLAPLTDSASQGEDAGSNLEEAGEVVSARPLRKRKKVTDRKCKMAVKNRKTT